MYDIAPVNLNSLINNIKVDIDRWKSLPLSIWGRIDTLKMNVLPRITFLVSAIPLPKLAGLVWRIYMSKGKRGALVFPKCTIIISPSRNSRFELKLGYGWDSRDTRWESTEQAAWDKSKDRVTLQGLWCGPIWKDIDNPLIEFSCTIWFILMSKILPMPLYGTITGLGLLWRAQPLRVTQPKLWRDTWDLVRGIPTFPRISRHTTQMASTLSAWLCLACPSLDKWFYLCVLFFLFIYIFFLFLLFPLHFGWLSKKLYRYSNDYFCTRALVFERQFNKSSS